MKVQNGRIHFWYKDYYHKGKRKLMVLSEIEFMRRFLQHVLPDNFYKIRYLGFLSNRYRRENILLARRAIAQNKGKHFIDRSFEESLREFIEKVTANLYPCPVCGGKMSCKPLPFRMNLKFLIPET